MARDWTAQNAPLSGGYKAPISDRAYSVLGASPQAPVSMAAWVYMHNATLASWVLGVNDFATGQQAIWLGLNNVGGGQTASFSTRSGIGSATCTTNPATYPLGEWFHVVGVTTGTANTYTWRRVWLNGSPGTASTLTTTTITGCNVSGIGARDLSGDNQLNIPGAIAWPAMWNAALTQDEITALYRGTKPTKIQRAKLVSFLPLQETTPYKDSYWDVANPTVAWADEGHNNNVVAMNWSNGLAQGVVTDALPKGAYVAVEGCTPAGFDVRTAQLTVGGSTSVKYALPVDPDGTTLTGYFEFLPYANFPNPRQLRPGSGAAQLRNTAYSARTRP